MGEGIQGQGWLRGSRVRGGEGIQDQGLGQHVPSRPVGLEARAVLYPPPDLRLLRVRSVTRPPLGPHLLTEEEPQLTFHAMRSEASKLRESGRSPGSTAGQTPPPPPRVPHPTSWDQALQLFTLRMRGEDVSIKFFG